MGLVLNYQAFINGLKGRLLIIAALRLGEDKYIGQVLR